MMDSGLEGPLCWSAELAHGGDAVRVAPVTVHAVRRHNTALPRRLGLLRQERAAAAEERLAQQGLGQGDRAMAVLAPLLLAPLQESTSIKTCSLLICNLLLVQAGTRIYVEAVRFNSTAPTKREAINR